MSKTITGVMPIRTVGLTPGHRWCGGLRSVKSVVNNGKGAPGLVQGPNSLNASYTHPGRISGTPRKLARDLRNRHLGAVLYELLTGRPPFRGETPLATMHQVANDDPVPPSRLVPKVARDLETICLKCLAKEPRKRYDSAQALADDLGRYLVGKPIKARPTPFWERGIKWTRRHPVPATVMIASVVVAISLLVAYIRYQRGVDRQIAMTTSRSAEVIFQAQEDMAQHQLDQAQIGRAHV